MRVPVLDGLLPGGTITVPLDPPSGGLAFTVLSSAPFNGTSAWPSANLAIFLPFVLNDFYPLARMGWTNGATVSGNVDVGIYDKGLNRILSAGSTAQSGVSAFQPVTVTATTLAPDYYWAAMAMDNATGTVQASTFSANIYRLMGLQQMATAFPLPSTVTLANPGSYAPVLTLSAAGVL